MTAAVSLATATRYPLPATRLPLPLGHDGEGRYLFDPCHSAPAYPPLSPSSHSPSRVRRVQPTTEVRSSRPCSTPPAERLEPRSRRARTAKVLRWTCESPASARERTAFTSTP